MGKFVKGDIVVIPFPFSDLSGSKRRPALVIADLDGDDVILCQITSVARKKFCPTEQDFYSRPAFDTLFSVPVAICNDADNHGGNHENLGKMIPVADLIPRSERVQNPLPRRGTERFLVMGCDFWVLWERWVNPPR